MITLIVLAYIAGCICGLGIGALFIIFAMFWAVDWLERG